MKHPLKPLENCFSEQSIQAQCFHPNGPFVEFKKEEIEQSIPDRFEQQVAKYPDRIAVKTKNHALTYDELNKTANRVARAIVAQRGEGNELIVLLFEQDVLLIAAILGVLKTGKFYISIDPSHLSARTNSIVEESEVGLILTDRRHFPSAEKLARRGCRLLNIDNLDPCLSTGNLGRTISGDSPATLLYTSGSTGRPKGVIHSHRYYLHKVLSFNSLYSGDNRLVQVGQITREMFNVLLNGAGFFPWNVKEEGLAPLADWLIQEGITLYHSVPSVFRQFAGNLPGDKQFPNLGAIILGGEPVYKRDVDLYKKRFSHNCILVNRLGATETGYISCYVIGKETPIAGDIVPVGYTVQGKKVLLLDDNGKEVGFNSVGEIAVKSRFLSSGYWQKPDLTRDAIHLDPAGEDERTYRTGDLGRMLPDGCLIYLGRKDSRVKVRGNRVELAEVEAVLYEHIAVKEAVVVAKVDNAVDTRLIAYIVPRRNPAPNITELRSFLKEKLPDYMIPSVFVKLDALPLTPNGKVDRKALPLPDNSRPELDAPFVAPRNPTEEKLAKIWAEVLSLDQIGIQDNFFDLGGHSLAATQVISRVINTFRVELPIKSLFESPTVADMAVVITQNQAKKARPEDLDRMLTELEALSDEEARRLLADESTENGKI